MMNHTPGPWHWETWKSDEGWPYAWLCDGQGEQVISDGSRGGEYTADLLPDDPNARLIAAAPDLLAALRAFLDDEPCSFDHHGYCQAHGHLASGPCHMQVARAVIAKATEVE